MKAKLMAKPVGRKQWVIAGGHISLYSTGDEPANTSHDKVSILNAGDREATVILTIFYTDRDPVGPYELRVAARRLRCFRFNDLIDPLPIPLDVDYACVIESDTPIVVQFSRLDTSRAENAILSVIAFSSDK